MNFRCGSRLTGAFLILWLCGSFAALSQDKEIRLRNERIRTVRPTPQAILPAANANRRPAAGLFLIQFTDRLDPSWRKDLSARGVELLRYVPDDAFVVRFRGAVVEEIQALPYVQWVGGYRPDHKLHDSLRAPAQARNLEDASRIAILLAPDATPADIAAARTGLELVVQESQYRFGSVLRGKLAPGQLQRLAESPSVLWIEPAPDMKINDELSSKIVGGEGTGHATLTQEMGFDGSGRTNLLPAVKVAVADTGLSTGTSGGVHPDLFGRATNFFYYGGLGSAADEHSHGTHVAGIVAGTGSLNTGDDSGAYYGLGVAPGAEIIAQRIFDKNGRYAPPPSFEALTRDAVSVGADIGNNSWGADTQGRYDVSAAEFDALVRDANTNAPGDQPYTLVFSAGNAGPGPQTIASPAVAKNVIAVGASQSSRGNFLTHMDGPEATAAFSSRGPSEDGRIKPDLVAPGTWIASLRSSVGNRSNAWLVIDDDYLYMGGSSQAAAHVSGAAAAFIHYYRETFSFSAPCPSPALIKAALIQSSGNLNASASVEPVPNSNEGWGRVDLTRIVKPPREPVFVDQGAGLTNGQHFERGVIVAGAAAPLKITMAYTDAPGFPAAIPALVNDLDLEVRAPDGRIYRGNQFNRGESVPNALSADNLNNVEGIYISEPLPGEYLIRVVARNVAVDALKETGAVDQDFALVIGGDIASAESGAVLLDRSHYTAPSRIIIRLFDNDRIGYDVTPVTVYSGSEPGGKELLLSAATSSGMFTGSIATVTAPTPGNNLRITNGDLIRVDYFDESVASNNFATAICDLLPPVISSVSVTNRFGRTVVLWTTHEPANSVVRFGTDSVLNRAVTNSLLNTTHELTLPPLVNGLIYSFSITSTDAAGNSATNGPSGPQFSFLAQSPATVLIVDAYIWDEVEDEIEPFIPLSTYTTPLEQLGVSYEIWSLEGQGSLPTFTNLQPYPIVMWRVNDSLFHGNDTIPTPQQAALQQYLDSGGSFFMASMDILSRLMDNGSTAFMTNVLHIGRFQRNSNSLRNTRCTNCGEDSGVSVARGTANDVIGDGILFSGLDYSAYYDPYGTFASNFADTFGVATNATSFLTEFDFGESCGLRFPRSGEDSLGRVVFVSFPLDAIPESGETPNNRAAFLQRALHFLSPGLNGVGSITFGRATHKIPDLLTIEIADSDLAGTPSVTAQVFSTSAPFPIDVTLRETPRPGVFRGFVSLVAATNPPVEGQLRATNGDILFADYFDESRQSIVQATATVDAVAAGISNVIVAPSFQSVRIRWTTSEPTDALVQFGESAFLGRTAYDADLRASHEIQLTGLFPGHTYYFKLVSRDAAGNTTVGDNGGQLYSFHTRPPLTAPFVDLLPGDTGTNWSIINGSGTQFQWQLGAVNNGHATRSTAWASNPSGAEARLIDTILLSPAINLAGGNVASLEFWQAYKFNTIVGSDIVNKGQLFIVTNSVSAPQLLAEYTGATPSAAVWQREQIDLTPYVGQVIVLAWRHHLDSIQMDERPGWALDDFSVTVSNIQMGTIELSNNLAQATVSLTGPKSRIARGYYSSFTNLLPGQYIATWSSVPYYETPPPQTNTLAPGGLLVLTGNYTFPDSNANDMSDLWELAYFGNLTNRTCLNDSDNDGSPDCSEFLAGTDPTSSASRLRMLPPVLQSQVGTNPPRLLLRWSAAPGHIYRLQSTFNFDGWRVFPDWLQATSNVSSTSIPAPAPDEPFVFRIEVRP